MLSIVPRHRCGKVDGVRLADWRYSSTDFEH
uniref:Uncharacterized protein n=1 Tax=Physcomitrium patens TaxID=3218 RepID=A0A2K1J1J2_PHYPA|nr:hypothetical protein PHYPA_023299 [Physcomitrium patens]